MVVVLCYTYLGHKVQIRCTGIDQILFMYMNAEGERAFYTSEQCRALPGSVDRVIADRWRQPVDSSLRCPSGPECRA